MHNPECVVENEMHKILGDFKIQTDDLVQARRPDLVIVYKKKKKNGKKRKENLQNSGHFRSGRPQIENKKIKKIKKKKKLKEAQVLGPC